MHLAHLHFLQCGLCEGAHFSLLLAMYALPSIADVDLCCGDQKDKDVGEEKHEASMHDHPVCPECLTLVNERGGTVGRF